MESHRCVVQRIEVSSDALQDREDAGTEPASAWTGEKKPKIQSKPTSHGDLGNTARDDSERSSDDEQEQQIEGLDWDDEKLGEEIGRLRQWKKVSTFAEDYAADHKIWVLFDKDQQTALNQRLALCRIRAHEKEYRDMDDESLLKIFPPSNLEENWYYEHYECDLDWFFDPTYCKLAEVENYQRMVLRVTAEFEDLDICPYTRNKLEDDKQFVQFWEELSRKTKLIDMYITERSEKRERIENLLLYHALKIAEGFPSVYDTGVVSRFMEFVWGVEVDYAYAGFFTKMWELLAKKKMNFTDALRSVYNEDKYRSMFIWGAEFEWNLFAMERLYKHHLDRIVEKAHCDGDVHQLVMDTIVENYWKPRTYYEYVRKKLRIAEEIRLISKQPPHKLYVPGCYHILYAARANMKTSGGKMASSAECEEEATATT